MPPIIIIERDSFAPPSVVHKKWGFSGREHVIDELEKLGLEKVLKLVTSDPGKINELLSL